MKNRLESKLKKLLEVGALPLMTLYLFMPLNEEYFAQPGRQNVRLSMLFMPLLVLLVYAALLQVPRPKEITKWKSDNNIFISFCLSASIAYLGLVGPWSDDFYERYAQVTYTREIATPVAVGGMLIVCCAYLVARVVRNKNPNNSRRK